MPTAASTALAVQQGRSRAHLDRLSVAVAAADAAVCGVRRISAGVTHPGAHNTLKPRERGFRVPVSRRHQQGNRQP